MLLHHTLNILYTSVWQIVGPQSCQIFQSPFFCLQEGKAYPVQLRGSHRPCVGQWNASRNDTCHLRTGALRASEWLIVVFFPPGNNTFTVSRQIVLHQPTSQGKSSMEEDKYLGESWRVALKLSCMHSVLGLRCYLSSTITRALAIEWVLMWLFASPFTDNHLSPSIPLFGPDSELCVKW